MKRVLFFLNQERTKSKYAIYIAIISAPSILVIFFLNCKNRNNTAVSKIIAGIPTDATLAETGKSKNNAGTAKTNNELNMLEPKMFPRAISKFLFLIAAKLTESSGKDVPSATNVNAITDVLEKPRICVKRVTLVNVNVEPR